MSGLTKSERLEEMKRLYIQRAYSDKELAERLGVNRTQIYRDRIELSREYPIEKDQNGRYHIPRSKLLSEIKVNLLEALTLYLAASKIARQTRVYHPPAANAVEKLAAVLRQPMTEQLLNSANRLLNQEKKPEKIKILETIAQAWVEQRKVRMEYQRLGHDEITRHTISPYLIEPSIWSDSVYVIAQSDFNDKIYPFKIDRILSAFLTSETFAIPSSFSSEDLLKHAWGIWYADREPVTVKLRFFPSPTVIQRLEESIWHPLERVEKTEDGGRIWSVEIADWREMLPWIRGWGADVEVLEPPDLRSALEKEARRMAKLYGMGDLNTVRPRFFAHRREDEDSENWQPLIEHLRNTAAMARDFGKDANVADFAYITGLLHDLGKYSDEFQKRLVGSGRRVDHSTAGAKELISLFKDKPQRPFAYLLAYPILGHHAGLPDYGSETDLEGGTLCARLKNVIPDYSAYKNELDVTELSLPLNLPFRPLHLPIIPQKPPKNYFGFSLSFMARMIYSALVDADFQETETYMRGKKPRGEYDKIPELRGKLDQHLRQFEKPTSEINQKRNEILHACIEKAKTEKPGFFSLTVPTGGGKTLASMAFALHHAAEYGLRRVIYVIPFTTIIEQNAGVFKNIFGEEQVLEHHSNFDWEGKNREDADNRTNSVLAKLKLAAENWEIPIVVTTNVQFFESLFANKSSRCRKLHNIAKSVIIFDEAQMLPREYMRPAMAAVWELVTNYGVSALFCTATQPRLERFLPLGTEVKELAPNPQELFDFYKRVDVQNLGTLTDVELLDRLNRHDQVLCIVNTRRHASGLFKGLQGDGNFHLSTLMCPVHRRAKLEEIKKRLSSGKSCRVVSTTVMEAGIDLDFPIGYRALSGLDSINQAAGRVNREMRQPSGYLFVFEPKSEFINKTPSFIKQAAEVARMVLRDHAKAPISIPAIQAFFGHLYNLQDPLAFDFKRIMDCFEDDEGRFKFETASRAFQIIEDPTVTVIIPFNEEAKKLIEELKYTKYPFSTLRKLQPYTVSIYKSEFDKLSSKGVVLTIEDTYHFLNPDNLQAYYDPHCGLLIPENGGGDGLLF
ncbi:CRISPR-associated helicase Cas3/ [Bellilinea caldifistulae]|nr:CRISPR-associated helicase/endonuclease Cas3 [Bellilinea caldifistulae]GAP10225.1 CRISPR-associated helicase Cas3/ [Bellilinea caldifistulae]